MSNTKHPTNELLVSLAAFGTGGCGFIDWFQASALGGGFVVARLEIERAALRRLYRLL